MKKIFTAIFAATTLFATAAVEDPNTMIIHFNDGTSNKIDITNADYIEFTKEDHSTPDVPDVPVTPSTDPKVGDYFYSDGTWSDGGLISIDADGKNAVWAAQKPAPVAGKTVVGIVFSTNPDRMGETEKAMGYTHGYVIGCKNIIDPSKKNYDQWPETVWFADQYTYTSGWVQVNQVAKSMKSCYENLAGYDDTWKIINNIKEVDEEKFWASDAPLFFNGTINYPVEAPANTSGWFIPSVGQMWDCVANFCSGEVAAYLATLQTNTYDFTYYSTKRDLSSAPFDDFMKPFELVADTDKDEITYATEGDIAKGSGYLKLATATRYDDESRVVIDLGMGNYGLVEGMAAWFDEESLGRPILAF